MKCGYAVTWLVIILGIITENIWKPNIFESQYIKSQPEYESLFRLLLAFLSFLKISHTLIPLCPSDDTSMNEVLFCESQIVTMVINDGKWELISKIFSRNVLHNSAQSTFIV